jgi:hypothetical protein
VLIRTMFVLVRLSPVLCQIDFISLFANKNLIQHGDILSNWFAIEVAASSFILCFDKTATLALKQDGPTR